MPAVADQIPLQISLRQSAQLATFVGGSAGAEALRAVSTMAEGRGERFLFLHGPPGAGKTHLLAGACNHAATRGLRSAYLPLAELVALDPAVLHGLAGMDLVCVDDVEQAATATAWERALFILYNDLRVQTGRLIAAAAVPPSALPLRLPDLRSRLAWGLTLALRPLAESELGDALRAAAAARGLALGAEVTGYLLRRCPRDLRALLRLLDRLDQASLAAQRPLTVPFVRSILQEDGPADR